MIVFIEYLKENTMKARKLILCAMTTAFAMNAMAQVPDLLTAFDAGGRSMGSGGGMRTAGSDTQSALSNPAGLGFASRAQVSTVIRNLPESQTQVAGDFGAPQLSTKKHMGGRSLSHVGIVMPMSKDGGAGGALGFSLTTGGYFRDLRVGTGLRDGDLTVNEYAETIKTKTDFLTASYGKSSKDGRFAYGIGVVIGTQSTLNSRQYKLTDSTGADRGTINSTVDEQGIGVGGVIGVQFIPAGGSSSLGISLRSPIDLSGNDKTSTIYDRIPGKASMGYVVRRDGLRGGKDFLIAGIGLDYYFGGKKDATLSRDDQFVGGGGVEYNYSFGNAIIPLRVGLNLVPAGSDYFTDRNALTFGFGYRPSGGNFSLDLDFASPTRGGGVDMSLGLTYRFPR